jgi:hypothetical protein
MAFYLTQFSYTPETWARLTKNPEDRREAARKYIESVGGKLHGCICQLKREPFDHRKGNHFSPLACTLTTEKGTI